MKYLILVFLLSTQISYAQNNKISLDITTDGPDCPPGLCPVAYINIEIFNFHKPRTGCKSGFGICLRLSAGVTCEYCRWRTSMQNNQVMTYVTFEQQKIVWHLPAALQQAMAETDCSTFELEEDMLEFKNEEGKAIAAKAGNYPVVKKDDELIITIDIK